MFTNFKYESIPLKDILLDNRNPRIVTQNRLSSQAEILSYLFEHEDLAKFINKIVSEGKNVGAERPYVVKTGSNYTVIEGNTRIAAYKVLTGMMTPPKEYSSSVPHISEKSKTTLLTVDCSIAPSRDLLLPIMANAHFGLGDKSKWGSLGSRKAVYDEWHGGKGISKLANAFDRTPSQIKELILEYILYLKALSLNWTKQEKDILLEPSVEFNPPVRFLQTSGHKKKMGINFDTGNLKIVLNGSEAKKKFKHLLKKLVINPQKGLGATATYEDVFADYTGAPANKGAAQPSSGTKAQSASGQSTGAGAKGSSAQGTAVKPGSLFSYPVTGHLDLSDFRSAAERLRCKLGFS